MHKWGFEIKPSVARLKWFKLLLDPTKYASNTSPTIVRTKALIPSSKRPVNVVADYLSCLKKHTTKALERAYGKAFVEVTPVDYCLTVPAVSNSLLFPRIECDCWPPLKIWNDAAKALTLQAAESAGFGMRHTIRLISEPEAAAAWSLMKDIQPNNLKVRRIRSQISDLHWHKLSGQWYFCRRRLRWRYCRKPSHPHSLYGTSHIADFLTN